MSGVSSERVSALAGQVVLLRRALHEVRGGEAARRAEGPARPGGQPSLRQSAGAASGRGRGGVRHRTRRRACTAAACRTWAATLDRAKYFLAGHQTPPYEPCLRELTEEEAVAFLWDGPHGVVREVCQTGLEKETDVDALELLTRVREKLRRERCAGLGQCATAAASTWRRARQVSVVRDAFAGS